MSSATKPGATTRRNTAIFALVIILIGTVTYIFGAYEYNYPPFCSGYPPGGDCPGTYTHAFTISLNYTGPWRLTYQGYLGMGESDPAGVSGNLTGSGPYSQPVTLFGQNNNGLTLCATAQKLDGSNSTLILTVTGQNETSLPHGTTSYCGIVAP